jgi:hypothetical protein
MKYQDIKLIYCEQEYYLCNEYCSKNTNLYRLVFFYIDFIGETVHLLWTRGIINFLLEQKLSKKLYMINIFEIQSKYHS